MVGTAHSSLSVQLPAPCCMPPPAPGDIADHYTELQLPQANQEEILGVFHEVRLRHACLVAHVLWAPLNIGWLLGQWHKAAPKWHHSVAR